MGSRTLRRTTIGSGLGIALAVLSLLGNTRTTLAQAPPVCLGSTATIWVDGANVVHSTNPAQNSLPYGGTLLGTNQSDVIVGTNGNDIIYGNQGQDVICGLDGDDTIFGGEGSDQIDGGAGNDTIFGDTGPDQLDQVDEVDRCAEMLLRGEPVFPQPRPAATL